MLWRRNSARIAQCVTIGVVPPVVRISGNVIVRRVRGKMDKFGVVQRKRKRSSSRERDFCKRDRNDSSLCSESASQVFSSENDIGNFVGVPLTDADRRKVLFNCWCPPGFSFPYATAGAQNRSFQCKNRLFLHDQESCLLQLLNYYTNNASIPVKHWCYLCLKCWLWVYC